MAIKKRIADLSAALTADTREYEAGMKRAARSTQETERQIERAMGGVQRAGLKLGLGLVGSGGALALLTNEIRHVIRNIESIPGVPAETIASVQQARYAFEQSRQGIDQAIAGTISFTSWVARAAGFLSGALVYGLDSAEQAYWEFGRAAANAALEQQRQADAAKRAAEETAALARIRAHARSIEDKEISANEAAIDRLTKAQEAWEHKDETAAQRMGRLRREARAAEKVAATTEGRAGALAQAEQLEKLLEADKLEKQLTAVAEEHLRFWNDFFAGPEVNDAPDAVENVAIEVERASDAAEALGWAFESAFETAILEGEKLSDVLKGLADDLMRIAIRKTITDPLIGALFGDKDKGTKGLFGGFFAGGGDPPVGRPSMVGEKGPELFVPRTAGTIVPNHQLGGGGNTYYIDARGADQGAVQRIEAALIQLAGPGVTEKRAIGAMVDVRRRRSSNF